METSVTTMIFYFSATGNSKYVAERIAAALREQAVSIVDCLAKKESHFEVHKGETAGIVTPTYFWGLPTIVCEFLSTLKLSSRSYVFSVSTYGTTTGQTGAFIDQYLKLDARFCVKMPDTWTPVFDLSDAAKVAGINAAAEPQIQDIIERVQRREPGDFLRNKVPMLAVKLYYKTYDVQRKTSHFSIEDACTGCGLCARKCPVQAIEIQNRRPVWTSEQCALCLGCLHRCPVFAIQYGKNTKRHGQYLNPNTKGI